MSNKYNLYNQQVLNMLNEFIEDNKKISKNLRCSYLVEIKHEYKSLDLNDKTIKINIENVLEILNNYFNSIFSNIQNLENIESDNREIDCLLFLKLLDIKFTSNAILDECSEYIDLMENLLTKIKVRK